MSQSQKVKVQTRRSLVQHCLPTGPASARRYDGHHTSLEDSSVDGNKNAGFDMRLRPDIGAQFGDRAVGGPAHQDDVNDPQGNRMLSPQPHVIAEKSFYTEVQGTYTENPSNPPFPFGSGTYTATCLRVDLTQGGTAFRANCVVVRGTMSIINQPIAGTAGTMGTVQNGFSVNSTAPNGSQHILVPTLDFEHIFICQPLHSLTNDDGGFPINNPWYQQDPVDLINHTVNNPNPAGPGMSDYEGYSNPFPTLPETTNVLGSIATKNSNYFRVRNRGVDPADQSAQQFDWDTVESPLASFANTPGDNYAQFAFNQYHNGNIGVPGDGLQVPTYTQGAATANNVDVASQSHGTDGSLPQVPGRNLNWVDFKYRFPNLFNSDYYQTFINPNPDATKLIGYSPRVAVKGTYLLI